MKKIFFIVLLVSVVLGLSATAAYAGPAPSFEPGCNPAVMDILNKQAQAARVRNRAYEMDIIHRNESTLGLTCFDQAVRLSTRLGFMFSDVIPVSPPVQNEDIFTETLAFSGWGAQQMLAKSLNNVINNVADPPGFIDVFMANFPPPLPPVLSPNALAALWQPLNTVIGNVSGSWSISGYQWNVDRLMVSQANALTTTINNRISNLSSVSRDPAALQRLLPAAYQAIRDLIDERDRLFQQIEAGREQYVGPRLDDLRDIVRSDTEMSDECKRATDNFWTEGNPNSKFPAPEGDEYFVGTPYYSLKEFLQGPPLPGAGQVFLDQITPPNDNFQILEDAYDALVYIETFSGPMVNVWQITPPVLFTPRKTPLILTPALPTADIIKAM